MTLIAKKITAEEFTVPGGYIKPAGEWGVYNTATGAWMSFDGETPYRPAGGRRACQQCADTCNPAELVYATARTTQEKQS